MSSSKRVKPQGELVWVMDGKTEYMGQLIEPLSMAKAEEGEKEEDVELEVKWTHNGTYEWVTLDRVRVDSSGPRRRISKKTEWKSMPAPEKKQATPAKTKGSPKKKGLESSTKKSAQTPEKEKDKTSKKRPAKEAEEEPKKAEGTKSLETKTEEPPAKKQKVRSGDTATGANVFFASLTSQVVGAKNAVVSGFQEVYKELMGSSSSS
jgi:hypothetical protein